jgi:hypothetical protein
MSAAQQSSNSAGVSFMVEFGVRLWRKCIKQKSTANGGHHQFEIDMIDEEMIT